MTETQIRYYEAVKASVVMDVVAKGHAKVDDILITMTPQAISITSEKEPIGDIFARAFPEESEQYKGQKEIQMLYPKAPNRAERRRRR